MIKKKLFRLLWSLIAYLLFAVLWIMKYFEIYYSNQPEEVFIFRGGVAKAANLLVMTGVSWLVSFSLFILFGLIYLYMHHLLKLSRYVLTALLLFTAYCNWIFSVTLNRWNGHDWLCFVNLVLFGLSVHFINKNLLREAD